MKFPFQQQENEWDCSMACIYMLFQHYHNNQITYFQFIKENYFFQDLNLLQMQRVADKYGVFLSAYWVKWDDLMKTKLKTPLICQIQTTENKFHFIIIYKETKKQYLIADPFHDQTKYIDKEELKQIYTGVVLKSEKTIWWKPEYGSKISIFLFWNNLWFALLILTIMGIFITIVTIAIQFMMKMLIDEVLGKNLNQLLSVIIIGLSLLYLQKLILQFTFNVAINQVEKTFKQKWNLKFLNCLKKLSFLDYQKYKTHNIVQNYYYFNQILNFYFPMSLEIIKSLFILIASLGIILIINPNILLPIILLTSLFFLLYFVLHPWILQYEKTVILHEKKWQNNFLDFCQNYLSYKGRNLILWRGNFLFENLERQFELLKTKNRWINVQLIINEVFASSKTLIVIYLLLSDNHSFLQKPGSFIFLFALINNVISQTQFLHQGFWAFSKVKNFKERVYPFIFNNLNEKLIAWDLQIQKITVNKCNIKLDGLNKIWKNNLNLTFSQNMLICGDSGTGKTILLQILNNYWPKYEGEIIINDQSLQKIKKMDYEKQVYLLEAYAPVFPATIFENITAYQRNKQILEIWKKWALNDFLKLIKLTATSEISNSTISNGQRQIINFLTLFFRRESLFLLDESLNSIPTKWKKELIQKLLSFQKNKIICYVTHDFNLKPLFKKTITLEKNEL